MKNIIAFIAIIGLLFTTDAHATGLRVNQKLQRQKLVAGVPVNISVNDTTSGADTTYLFFSSVLAWNIGVQWTITNVTNTTGGTVTYWGSPDNITWYQVQSDTSQCNSCLGTVAVSGLTSGATLTKAVQFRNFQFLYFRARDITSGSGQTSYWNGTITEYPLFISSVN